MRPGEPARSTLVNWVRTCRGCGAAAEDLTTLPEAARAVVASPAYRALADAGSADTLPFRRCAMLLAETGAPDRAAEALLWAAWAADDAEHGAEAASLRRRVATLWGDSAGGELGLRRLDVLRCAGATEAAAEWADRLMARGVDELGQSIVAYQRRLIAAGDTGRHLISSALPPPAHKPHVSHGPKPATGRKAAPGFFGRLFGR